MSTRFAPRVTRAPRASRLPMASWLWPETSGATKGSSASRSVEKSNVGAGDDGRLARQPGLAKGAAATPGVQVQGVRAPQTVGQLAGDGPGPVGAGVVDDRDDRRERKTLVETGPQPPDAGLEIGLLVVDRHHHVHDGRARASIVRRGGRLRLERRGRPPAVGAGPGRGW